MQLKLTDLGTNSECGFFVESEGTTVRFSIYVEANGDLDIALSRSDFRRLAEVLAQLARDPPA